MVQLVIVSPGMYSFICKQERKNPLRGKIMNASEIDRTTVLHAAKVAALWSTSAEIEGSDADNLDDIFSPEDISGETETKLIELIDNFFDLAYDLLDDYPLTAEQLGHDLILTANRHGAGFWDRGLGELGEKLTTLAHSLGGYQLYVGDDGKLYV
jgi:hypothetical protein